MTCIICYVNEWPCRIDKMNQSMDQLSRIKNKMLLSFELSEIKFTEKE